MFIVKNRGNLTFYPYLYLMLTRKACEHIFEAHYGKLLLVLLNMRTRNKHLYSLPLVVRLTNKIPSHIFLSTPCSILEIEIFIYFSWKTLLETFSFLAFLFPTYHLEHGQFKTTFKSLPLIQIYNTFIKVSIFCALLVVYHAV